MGSVTRSSREQIGTKWRTACASTVLLCPVAIFGTLLLSGAAFYGWRARHQFVSVIRVTPNRAEPDAGKERWKVDRIGARLVADIEGLGVYYGANGDGYLIASGKATSDSFR